MTTRPSFILVSVVLTSALLLAALTALLSAGNAERQIATSQFTSVQGYNLAEGAVQHAVWRLKNDPTWSTQFVTNPNWSASINRTNVFNTGASYSLSVQNTELGHAAVIATSTWPLTSGVTAQRVVKVKVFKALGVSTVPNLTVLSDTGVTAQLGAVVNVALGQMHANGNININWWSNVQVQATTSATGTISVGIGSTLASPIKRAINFPPVATRVDLPQVDFDSADPGSFRSRAQATGHVYTANQFSAMMAADTNLATTGTVTYVTGEVDIKKGYHLTVNGVLAADGQIRVGNTLRWTSDWTELRVVNTAGQPSGLFSKSRISLGLFTSLFQVNGVVYANDQFSMLQILQSPTITGALFARSIDFNGILSPVTIVHSQTIADQSLGTPQFSPVISVEHWEEEY
jgi:hypothetical protein